jgi:hypothetical protein
MFSGQSVYVLRPLHLAEVRTLKARYALATVKLALSKYRERDPRRGPTITWSCAGRKMRSGQRFSDLSLEPEEIRALERRLPRAHPPRPIQSHPARVRRPSSKRLSNSWPAWAWMALTGRRPAEIFFSASFSLP